VPFSVPLIPSLGPSEYHTFQGPPTTNPCQELTRRLKEGVVGGVVRLASLVVRVHLHYAASSAGWVN
jgi:hypothetical protein